MSVLTRDIHTLTGVYAIDALETDAERGRFERHLHRCHSCTTEVRELQETATRLGMAAARQPPSTLRGRVMAAVERTRQLPAVAHHARPQPRARWVPRLAAAATSLAVAAAVVLGVDLASTQHQLTHAQQQLAQARAQGRAIQRELALSQAQARSFAVLLAAPDARILSHASTHGGTATLVVSIRQRQLVVTTAGLPALPSGKVYQLWMIGKHIYPAGFLPRAVAGRTTPVRATRVIAGDTFGVTVEPAGGTKQPTTTPIIAIPLPR